MDDRRRRKAGKAGKEGKEGRGKGAGEGGKEEEGEGLLTSSSSSLRGSRMLGCGCGCEECEARLEGLTEALHETWNAKLASDKQGSLLREQIVLAKEQVEDTVRASDATLSAFGAENDELRAHAARAVLAQTKAEQALAHERQRSLRLALLVAHLRHELAQSEAAEASKPITR